MMKASCFIATYWVLMVLSCCSAQAQDPDRKKNSVDAIDASTHAAVDGKPQKPLPSVDSTKQPTTFSSWSLQGARHTPTNLFRADQSTKSAAVFAGGKNPSTPGGMSFQQV